MVTCCSIVSLYFQPQIISKSSSCFSPRWRPSSFRVSLSVFRKLKAQAPPYGCDHPPFSVSCFVRAQFFSSYCPHFLPCVSRCLTPPSVATQQKHKSAKVSTTHKQSSSLHPQIFIYCVWSIKSHCFSTIK